MPIQETQTTAAQSASAVDEALIRDAINQLDQIRGTIASTAGAIDVLQNQLATSSGGQGQVAAVAQGLRDLTTQLGGLGDQAGQFGDQLRQVIGNVAG